MTQFYKPVLSRSEKEHRELNLDIPSHIHTYLEFDYFPQQKN